jgi:dihydrofolate reductase
MSSPTISIIVACDEKRGIGKNNTLLWKIPEDQKFFKETTMGHPIIMGSKTYESIRKPLSGRTNIVITRDPNYQIKHPELMNSHKVFNSLEDALDYAKTLDKEEIFVVGGGQIYQQSLDHSLIDKIYLTLVRGDFKAEIFFPEYKDRFNLIKQSDWKEENGFKFQFQELVRVN